jgi:drug/metabolite transporter (DMT)-like permease
MAGDELRKSNSRQRFDFQALAVPLAVAVYILCSSCMLVVNKSAMKVLPHVYTNTAMQTAASAVLLLAARHFGYISFSNPTLKVVWGWSGVLAAWIVPILLNMKAVHLVSVETMMMFRSLTIVAVAIGDYFLLKTTINFREGVSCLVISVGGLIYASNDLNFHFEGYVWGAAYSLGMVVNSLYIKHCFNQHKDMSSWEKSFLNNLLATPAVLMLVVSFEDVSTISNDLSSLSFTGLAVLILSLVMGLGISMSGTKCRDVLSATSFDVLGNCTKYLTLGLSALILNTHNSLISIFGICIALSGTMLYSPAGETLWRIFGVKKQA